MNQVKQKMKAAREKNQKEVEAILTQEQLEKLNALKAERKEKRDDKRTKGKNLRMQK
jgi:Spy/CpxP family protein refolding chaperone